MTSVRAGDRTDMSNQNGSLCFSKKDCARHAIDSEFGRVCRSPLDGVYIIPSASNPFVWFGLIFIRRGIYEGGIFRFSLELPEDFPDSRKVPTVRFDSDVFHPDVYPTNNTLDLSKNFPDGYRKDKHHVVNVLLAVQRIFFSSEANVENCANPEAAILWKEHRNTYKELAKDCVNKGRAKVYDEPLNSDDPNAIRLTPWDSSVHTPVREEMMALGKGQQNEMSNWNERAGKQNGFSWVDTERMTYMTEPYSAKETDINAEKERLAFGIERLDLTGLSSDSTPPPSPSAADAEYNTEVEEEDNNADLDMDEIPISNREHQVLTRTDGISPEDSPRPNGVLESDAGESAI